jgi:hypothetical protein
MEKLPTMVNLAYTKEESEEKYGKDYLGDSPKYPYCLSITLNDSILKKLNLSTKDFAVDDTIHLFCFAKVTSIRSHFFNDKEESSVELIITDIASENEDKENEEMDKKESKTVSKTLYGSE